MDASTLTSPPQASTVPAKQIEVVAAVIRHGNEIFATQRGYGDFKDWWEFPGGKIEQGESPREALIREIKEELNADIAVGNLIKTVEWNYPNFHLRLHCFWCELSSEVLHLNEHEAATWLTKDTLFSVKWLPADEVILKIIYENL
ncbi:MAG: (deoxy)nucleoside triphosphate pyrophosphohydrolase [Bacteroidales bacterium]|nr:(deoxy)nucleoside triphosphate pyrophosphohydrolase [Bacteroidales bacterium]